MSEDTDAEKSTKGKDHKTGCHGKDRAHGVLADEPKNGCPMNGRHK